MLFHESNFTIETILGRFIVIAIHLWGKIGGWSSLNALAVMLWKIENLKAQSCFWALGPFETDFHWVLVLQNDFKQTWKDWELVGQLGVPKGRIFVVQSKCHRCSGEALKKIDVASVTWRCRARNKMGVSVSISHCCSSGFERCNGKILHFS